MRARFSHARRPLPLMLPRGRRPYVDTIPWGGALYARSTRDYRNGPGGEATNELESLLTAVVTSADMLADGEVADGRMLQRDRVT